MKQLVFFIFSFTIFNISYTQIKTIPEQEVQAGSGIFFGASMDQLTSEITVTMKGPDDRWFGVGFGLSMADADVLMYTDGKVGAMHPLGASDYDLNAQNTNGVDQDANQDWTIISDNATGGTRTINASRTLNTGDVIDHIINFNAPSIDIIWAKGNSADYTLSYHGASNRGTTTFSWQVQDITPPSLIVAPFSPADDQIDVSLSTNMTVSFDEQVSAGAGNIELRLLSTNNIVEIFDVTTNVTFSANQLTINPTSNLSPLTDYYIIIPNGAIEDIAGNAYSGFNDNSTWNFTTLDNTGDVSPPTPISPFVPADDQSNVSINTPFSITFNEDVQAGAGAIELYLMSTGTLVESFNITGTSVSINGSTVDITPSNSLNFFTDYYVTISGGAIVDLASNPFAGFNDDTSWNFTTIDDNNGIGEITSNFVISLDSESNVSIQNMTGVKYAIEVVSLVGQSFYTKESNNPLTILNLEKYSGHTVLVKLTFENDVLTKMIKL